MIDPKILTDIDERICKSMNSLDDIVVNSTGLWRQAIQHAHETLRQCKALTERISSLNAVARYHADSSSSFVFPKVTKRFEWGLSEEMPRELGQIIDNCKYRGSFCLYTGSLVRFYCGLAVSHRESVDAAHDSSRMFLKNVCIDASDRAQGMKLANRMVFHPQVELINASIEIIRTNEEVESKDLAQVK